MNLLKRKKLSIIIGLALFTPFAASACGGSQPGAIFVIFLPIAILIFLFISRKYILLIFKDKKIILLTVISLLVIGMITAYKMVETKKGYDIEHQKINECMLENYRIQNLNETSQQGETIHPCGVPTAIRSTTLNMTWFILSSLFIYSIFMMLYGIYEIKKKNDIGKKILKFFISLILLLIFAYISLIMMSTVLLC